MVTEFSTTADFVCVLIMCIAKFTYDQCVEHFNLSVTLVAEILESLPKYCALHHCTEKSFEQNLK